MRPWFPGFLPRSNRSAARVAIAIVFPISLPALVGRVLNITALIALNFREP
jgi:hypothetical protein